MNNNTKYTTMIIKIKSLYFRTKLNDKIKLWNKKTVPYAQALENRYKDADTFDSLLNKYLDI